MVSGKRGSKFPLDKVPRKKESQASRVFDHFVHLLRQTVEWFFSWNGFVIAHYVQYEGYVMVTSLRYFDEEQVQVWKSIPKMLH